MFDRVQIAMKQQRCTATANIFMKKIIVLDVIFILFKVHIYTNKIITTRARPRE